jgi:hypothetical protein
MVRSNGSAMLLQVEEDSSPARLFVREPLNILEPRPTKRSGQSYPSRADRAPFAICDLLFSVLARSFWPRGWRWLAFSLLDLGGPSLSAQRLSCQKDSR